MNILIPELVSFYFKLWDNLHSTGATKFLLIGVPPFDRSPPIISNPNANAIALSDAINTFNGQIAEAAYQWASANAGVRYVLGTTIALLTK